MPRMPHAIGVAVRGLRSRALLTVVTVLLATIGVAAAVVGPSYLRAATNSLLVDRLELVSTTSAGLTWRFEPPDAWPPRSALARANTAAAVHAPDEFGSPTTRLISKRFAVGHPGFLEPIEVAMTALEKRCAGLVVTGRCPRRPYEVLVAGTDVERGGYQIGDRIRVTPTGRPATVVGSFELEPDYDWFDRSRFASVPPAGGREPQRPYQPAPFVTTPATFDQLRPNQWWAEVDRPLVPDPMLTPSRVDELAAISEAEQTRKPVREAGGRLGPAERNDLRGIVDDIESERQTARYTVLPAALSLSLVALLLLFRLLSERADLRRSEFALLSLRGWSHRRLWAFGLTESLLVLLIAAPIGVLSGWQATRLLADAWLQPGIPVGLTAGSLLGAAGIVAAGLVAASLALVHVMRERLHDQLEATSRPRPMGRVELAVQAGVGAAAVAGAYVVAGQDGRGTPGLVDLLLPVLLALAIGLVAGHLTVVLAASLTRRTARARSLASFLSARRLARRREATLVVLPLAVALGVGVFAVGVQLAAATWRDSVAVSRVGADLAYVSDRTPEQTMAATHRIDPDGEWLMAGATYRNVLPPQIIALDTNRMAAVGEWSSAWGAGDDAAAVAERFRSPHELPHLEGRQLSLDITNQVESENPVTVTVRLRDVRGEHRDAVIEPPTGRATRSAPVPCRRGCDLLGISVTAAGGTLVTMHGGLTVHGLSVDGTSVEVGLDDGDAWRPARPYTRDDGTSVVAIEGAGRGSLRMRIDTGDDPDAATITPTDVPGVRPVVVTDEVALPAAPNIADAGLLPSPDDDLTKELDLAVRPVATSEAVPLIGRSGVLVDLNGYTREDFRAGSIGETSYVFARAGVPDEMLDALAAAGVRVEDPMRLSAERAALDNDAYALSLRLYVVVAAALLLLAFAGVTAHLVVSLPGRRHDAASLRVVGVSRRIVMRASLVDLAVTLGVAAVAGVVAGVVAQWIVLGQIRLGAADARSPDIPAQIDLTTLGIYSAATAATLLGLATAVAVASVRRARGAQLREAAR